MQKLFLVLLITGCTTPGNGISPKFIPDMTVNEVLKLKDYRSVENTLGDIMGKADSNASLPDIYFESGLSKQYLRLIFFPGDAKNSFSRIEIGEKSADKKYIELKKIATFKTESGIVIGSSLSFVIATKGSEFTKYTTKGIIVLSYKIKDFAKSSFLARYNMPSYTADYYFKQGKLFKMSYGFDYP